MPDLDEAPVGRPEDHSFSGAHYTLVDSPALPKPVQRPGPPVVVGGTGPNRTPELAARFGSEINVGFSTTEVAATQFERVYAACRAIGRDPGELGAVAGADRHHAGLPAAA